VCADRGVRQAELRRIHQVEELSAVLQVYALGDVDVLEEREVDVHATRSAQNIAASIAEGELRGDAPNSAWIVVKRRVEPLLTSRVVEGRIAEQVGAAAAGVRYRRLQGGREGQTALCGEDAVQLPAAKDVVGDGVVEVDRLTLADGQSVV